MFWKICFVLLFELKLQKKSCFILSFLFNFKIPYWKSSSKNKWLEEVKQKKNQNFCSNLDKQGKKLGKRKLEGEKTVFLVHKHFVKFKLCV